MSRTVVARGPLLRRLAAAQRVVQISAPAGSGKTVLVRSWIAASGLAERAAWVPAGRDKRRFWVGVADALRGTASGSGLIRPLTAAPDLDGWAVVERLLTDLAPLADRLWLVIDDAHDLDPEVLAQLELLVLRAPSELRFVLVTRHDLRLGLHRLRLAGELTEIRADDLRFSLAEARALFDGAGVPLPEAALTALHARTEGWAAGLRLAALSLAGHPDPERFAEEFSGSERMVADYLLAEVLDRQPEEVRRLLLRTSILERVNGDLADLLTGTGAIGGERILHDLEQAGAFVVSLDGARSWFRYHRLFAGLLQLELRRTEPREVTALHRAAAQWLAANGYPIEAVRHAQAAQDWDLAARLLADHWPDEYLLGRGSALDELLARFPAGTVAADAELIAARVAGDLIRGSLTAASQNLALATSTLASVPAGRRARAQARLSVLRFFLARRRMDFPVVTEDAQRLLALMQTADAERLGLGEDLRAAALISLGTAELWALRFEEAERHLEQGTTLARRIGRPYLEFAGLTYWAHGMLLFQPDRQPDRQPDWQPNRQAWQAVELAERHGWGDEPLAGIAYTVLGGMLLYQGRLADAEQWLDRADRTLRTEAEPAAGMSLLHARAVLEMARGRHPQALAAFEAADQVAADLQPHTGVTSMRSRMVQALVRAGRADQAAAILAGLDDHERASAEMRTAAAALLLARGDPQAAADILAPVLDGSVPGVRQVRTITAALQVAAARDALGDQAAAGQALEQALDIAESTGLLLPFLLDPVPALLERHRRYRPALIARILDALPAEQSEQAGRTTAPGLHEPLTDGETRVLRYLPSHLTAQEIASEMSLSVHTVTTHMRHLYAKLGVHRRREAVERARALGLLAPTPRITRNM